MVDEQLTQLLWAWNDGDPEALEKLMPLVFEELRKIARKRFLGERGKHTLQPTALVNELFLRLVGSDGQGFHNRAQFFSAMAGRMRRILIDHARRRDASKRGGDQDHMPLEVIGDVGDKGGLAQVDLLALEEALKRLGEQDARKEQIVTMRFFGGLTNEEISEVLELGLRTVKRDWSIAKSWLFNELKSTGSIHGA